jgi:hypothetical protein
MAWTNPLFNNLTEKARQRRQRSAEHPRKAQHTTKNHRRDTADRRMPPVMVRGGMDGMPFQARKAVSSKARRRYDVSLNIPGAEMRLPSLPQVAFGFRFISGIVAIGLAALLYFVWNSPAYKVEAAAVIGLQRITSRDVNTVIDVQEAVIFTLDPRELETTLQAAFPEFMSVSVDVSLPNIVDIEVVERRPILTWRQDGRTILVDASGVSFPAREMVETSTAVVVDAFSAPAFQQVAPESLEGTGSPSTLQQFMPVEMVSAILSMSVQAPENTPLVYDKLHGLGWKDTRGWEVYFGDVHEIDTKLNVYKALVTKFEKEGIQPVLISVEHVHSPYYRLDR